MALSEGTTTLPNDAAATPNYVFGPYDGSAFWLQRSPAAGDALAAKYVAGVGNYVWNGSTIDRWKSGDVSNAAAATGFGNVIPTGTYDATLPTITDGRWNGLQLGSRGGLHVNLYGADLTTGVAANNYPSADGHGASLNGIAAGAFGLVYNGSTWNRVREADNTGGALAPTGIPASGTYVWSGGSAWRVLAAGNQLSDGNALTNFLGTALATWNESSYDRWRGNTDVTALASGSRTTTQTVTLTNYNNRTLDVVLDMTNVAAGPSVTVTIDYQDGASSKWINLLTGAAITTVSTNRYRVGPHLAAVANSVAQDYLMRLLRIVVTANNANAGTYSLGYRLGR